MLDSIHFNHRDKQLLPLGSWRKEGSSSHLLGGIGKFQAGACPLHPVSAKCSISQAAEELRAWTAPSKLPLAPAPWSPCAALWEEGGPS